MTASPGITLSAAQARVVESRGRHVQVIACAGSGKTESVSRRVASLIAEGVKSHEIVAFTFTERAAAELKERISRRVADAAGEAAVGTLAQMYVGTIHGYCLRILQDHVAKFGNFDVVDEHRHAAMLLRFKKDIGYAELALGTRNSWDWEAALAFATAVDVVSNECIERDALEGTPFGTVYERYLDVMDRLHVLTYGRIIQEAVSALRDPEVKRRIVGDLKHLIVDEYQDINPSQDRLIELMSSLGACVCVVGDDDQAIYQWRGSKVAYIREFQNRYAGAEQIVLKENRRSLAPIVQAASALAETIPDRLSKHMEHTRTSDVAAMVSMCHESADDEAAAIAQSIAALHAAGVAYGDMAILFRSVSTSAGPITQALHDQGIPFSCGGRSGLFKQPEVRGLMKAHLWLVGADWWNADTRSVVKLDPSAVAADLCSTYSPAIDAAEVESLLEDWKKLVSTSRTAANLIEDLYVFLRHLGVDGWDTSDPSRVAQLGALARFSAVLADFENTTRRGRYETDETGNRAFRGGIDRGPDYYKRLSEYLRYYAQENYEEYEGEDGAGVDAVQIMTVHGAKGLEWPVVFMPSLQDRRFPSSKAGQIKASPLPDAALSLEARQRYAGGEDEERRLFYVAMTRARDVLYLSHFDRTAQRRSIRTRFIEPFHPSAFERFAKPVIPGPIASRRGSDRPLALSLTELIRYDDCGHRFRLQRVLGFETQLVSELGFGRAIHHVLRRIAEETRAAARVPELARIDAIMEQELYFPFANKSSEPLMRAKARNLVTHYVNRHRDDLLRIWATERPFELHLPEGFLSGRADVILDREGGVDGSLAILDYKSGTDGTSDDNFRFQLQVYAAAARSEGLTVDAAYLHDLANRNDPRSDVPVDGHACAGALDRARRIFGELSQRVFVPKPEPVRCGRCELREICPHRHPGP